MRLLLGAALVFAATGAFADDCATIRPGVPEIVPACQRLLADIEKIKNAKTEGERAVLRGGYELDAQMLEGQTENHTEFTFMLGELNQRLAVIPNDPAQDAANAKPSQPTPNEKPKPVTPGTPQDATTAGGEGLKPVQPPDPAVKAAQKDIESGNPADALKKLAQAIERKPDNPDTLALMARAKLATGDGAGALAAARRAQQLKPEDPALKALVSGLESSARAAKAGTAKLDFGGKDAPDNGGGGAGGAKTAGGPGGGGATRGPGAVVPGTPGGATVPPLEALLQRTRKLIDIGDFTGALLPLREAIDLDPKRGESWIMLAEVSSKAGNPAGAIDAANHALALNPDDARALRAKSYAELQSGMYKEALEDARRAVQLDPGNGLGYLYRGLAEEKLGHDDLAIADLKEAMRLDPTIAPLAMAALKRLGVGTETAPAGKSRWAFRSSALGLAALLIVLGLAGAAAGRSLTSRARVSVTPAPSREESGETTLRPGAVIGGHYRVERELGRGGMGVVYLAQDESLQRPVAIKQLQGDLRGNPADLEYFLREARLVAQLKHPNLAQIHSVVSEGGLLLVFEFVDGEPLDRLLGRAGKLAPKRARQLVNQICDALQCAHERKIVHRDLKPANVMIDQSGAAKVMDFGIAHQARGTATMTKTSVSGTPPYMSPEQGFGSVSKASDLYALAVMTYEMLTGRRPFEGPDFLEPKLRMEYEPASKLNPELGPAVDEFFKKALAADPTRRHADAAAFALEFGRALDATPSRA